MLVGYFKDDQKKYAKAPKLETDASANEYGQAEPVLTNAIHLDKMPLANIHAYRFEAGKHTLLLPTGMALVLGLGMTLSMGVLGNGSTWMFVLGIIILLDAIGILQRSLRLRRLDYDGWWISLILALVLALFGLILIANPFETTILFVRFLGFTLLADGCFDLWGIYLYRKYL